MALLGRKKSSSAISSLKNEGAPESSSSTMHTPIRNKSESILSSDIPTPLLLMKPAQISNKQGHGVDVGDNSQNQIFENFDGVFIGNKGDDIKNGAQSLSSIDVDTSHNESESSNRDNIESSVKVRMSTSSISTESASIITFDSVQSSDPLPQQVASIRLVSGTHAVASPSKGLSVGQSAHVHNIDEEEEEEVNEYNDDFKDSNLKSLESSENTNSDSSANTPEPDEVNLEITPETTHTTMLYHPKPQRLVSTSLTETPKQLEDVLGDDGQESSPIVLAAEHATSLDSNKDNGEISPDSQPDDKIESSTETAPENRQEVLAATEIALTGTSNSFLNPQPSNSHRRSYYPPMITTENNEQLVYYPAPIPVQLKLPPLLSNKKNSGITAERRRSRRLSFGEIQAMPPAKSVPNPLNQNAYRGIPDDIAELGTAARESVYEQHNASKGTSEQLIGGFYGRPVSPTLSISSGFATIESDSDDYQNNLLENEDDDDKSSRKKISKKKSKSHLPFGRSKDGHEYLDDDDSDYEAREIKDPDHLAFTSFNPSNVADRADAILSSRSGMVPLEGLRASSLIEELELRKAGRKTQHKLVLKEAEISQEMAKRTSKMHPLDRLQARSLLELQQIANKDYEEHKYLHDLSRLSVQMTKNSKPKDSNIINFQRRNSQNDLTSTVGGTSFISHFARTANMAMTEEERDANETLSERRQRLKMQKQLLVEPENETLAERRARLKQQKQFTVPSQDNRLPSLVL